jgi:hypothetical protein
MCEARSTKLLMKHPVFEQEFDFSGKYGLDLTDDRVHDLKKIFSIANLNQTGVIGRKQFTDLMDLLRISPTEVRSRSSKLGAGIVLANIQGCLYWLTGVLHQTGRA